MRHQSRRRRTAALGVVAVLMGPLLAGPAVRAAAPRLVEIRSYNLKPGTRDRFHQRFVRESLPMLGRWNVEVVAYGPSLHDRDSWFLMRAYASLDDRQKSEDAFYGSDEWKQGPREATLADIDSYTTVVLQLDGEGIRVLRSRISR